MTLIVDIETVPLMSALSAPYPENDRQPPGNYKNPEAIAKWRESDAVAWSAMRSKECSLNPRLGRVLCVGMSGGKPTDDPWVVFSATESDEARSLVAFWDEAKAEHGELITWNGAWDLRFLVIRSLSLGVLPTLDSSVIRSWFRKYSTHPHFDCRAVLTNWEPYKSGEGLDEWSTFFGIDGKAPGMSGADIYPLYQKGEFATIEAYCAQDVAATKAVYEKVAPMFADRQVAA